MKVVSVSEFQSNLTQYVREVQLGGEVQVQDRGAVVARLVPPSAQCEDRVRERLVGKGVLKPGKGASAAILEEAPLELPGSVSDALKEDREERLCRTGRIVVKPARWSTPAPDWRSPTMVSRRGFVWARVETSVSRARTGWR